jgi:hypothetical protein
LCLAVEAANTTCSHVAYVEQSRHNSTGSSSSSSSGSGGGSPVDDAVYDIQRLMVAPADPQAAQFSRRPTPAAAAPTAASLSVLLSISGVQFARAQYAQKYGSTVRADHPIS